MLLSKAWNRIYGLAREEGIIDVLGNLIEKGDNSVYKPAETMKTIFKGFMQQLHIYHIPLQNAPAHTTTYYRDMERTTKESYFQAKSIVEGFYVTARRKKKVNFTIDGTFVGVRGKTFERATKMYSGNRKDKGKKGFTIVTLFDTINKLPSSFEVPLIHELHVAPILIQKAIELEKGGVVEINLIVLDTLYLNKLLLKLVSNHKYMIKAPAQDWILKFMDSTPRGDKDMFLWGHKVRFCWRPSRDPNKRYDILITNTDYKKIWKVYGHNKQMVENYHDDLKNSLGIRKLPSRKFFAILVYFSIVILIYMLTRAVLLGIGMNRISCALLLFLVARSSSWQKVILNLSLLGVKLSKTAESLLKPG